MKVLRKTVEAKIHITVQKDGEEITQDDINKAILMTEVNINCHSGFCILGEDTKALYRCYIEKTN